MQKVITENHEHLKHLGDTIAIPSGLITGMLHSMEMVNGVMTFLVLLTSLVWGVYRIIDMRNKTRRKSRD